METFVSSYKGTAFGIYGEEGGEGEKRNSVVFGIVKEQYDMCAVLKIILFFFLPVLASAIEW